MRTRKSEASTAAARCALALLFVLLVALVVAPPARADDVAEPVGKVLTLPDRPGPHWFWLSDVLLHRTALFDGDSGRLLGTITAGSPGVGFVVSPLFSPDRREIYLAESYFSRGIRGDRTDVVTVYDGKTLLPQTEIPIPPKRAEYFPGVAANALSDDGRYIAVFNVTPAQSLTIVDAPGRRFVAEVPTPGCSLVYPAGPRRFFMLCADGAALVIDVGDEGGTPTATCTQKFFDAEKDPLAEKAVRRGNEWIFTSLGGVVHSIDLTGAEPRFGETWSLFDDADRVASWRVGGGQQVAIHVPSDRLFVLVHQGGADSHKEAGQEIWVYEINGRKRVQKIAVNSPLASFIRTQMRLGGDKTKDRIVSWLLDRTLPNLGANGILVTQDDHPVLVAMSMMPPAVSVYDAMSGAVVREVGEPGIAGSLLIAP